MDIETREIAIRSLRANSGEVDGLPRNPRKISNKNLEKLKKSLQDAPEMMRLRELIVVPHGDEFVVIAGNQRLEAAKAVGMKTLPCKVLPANTDPAKLREYAIKDNLPFGEDDWEVIVSDWDTAELEEWGMSVPEEWKANPDDYGTEFELPKGDKNQFGQMTFNVTENQRTKILDAVSLAVYCDGFDTDENANNNGAALYLIISEWLEAQKVESNVEKLRNSVEELRNGVEELRKYLMDALQNSGKTASDINRLLGNQMAGHYFGESQWMFPTRENYAKMSVVMDLPRDYYECKKIEKAYNKATKLLEINGKV